jgi:lipopolysaccharide/colanic/teichoic acid biosynthesis glycosyltransferase
VASRSLSALRAPDAIAAQVALDPSALTSETAAHIARLQAELGWDSYLPPRAGTRSWQIQQRIKRGCDIVIGLTMLFLLSPLFLIVAALIKVTSPGPVLYAFRVLGKRARPIVAFKFRTMSVNADELKGSLLGFNQMTGPAFKMREDPRVTAIGRFLRKYSIDELPQLWSVIVGDMSLVGPRPPFAEEFAEYKPWQWAKLSVTPGITCLWQVNGRSDITNFDDWASLDLQYIREWNLWLDFKIMLKTIPAVLRGRGAY